MSTESKRKISLANLGKKHSKETKKKISQNNAHYWLGKKRGSFSEEHKQKLKDSQKKGEEHHAWKGEKAKYRAVHAHISRKFGQPDTCNTCGKTGLNNHKIHWANISGKYKRDIKDWIRLCVKCHKKFDAEIIKPKGQINYKQ